MDYYHHVRDEIYFLLLLIIFIQYFCFVKPYLKKGEELLLSVIYRCEKLLFLVDSIGGEQIPLLTKEGLGGEVALSHPE